MRAVRFHEHGGPEVLSVDEIDAPDPAADEVLVEVDGAGGFVVVQPHEEL